jgi:CRISPR/Cas system CSM-associated protein Csm3 (group 7 of RAMP superfamily)
MNDQKNKLIIYEFIIQSVSAVYFGGSKQGELIKNSKGEPILFGNSIGGALRDYLEACDVPECIIYTYMGGNRNNEFWESLIYISDGKITAYNEICCKEGTAVDHAYGSAEKHHKYTLEHLPEGCMIAFQVECEVEDYQVETDFNKIIGTWENGFRDGDIKLGGQQNNGFGKFNLIRLEQKEFVFRTQDDLDGYIFNIANVEPKLAGKLPYYDTTKQKQVTFSLEGEFPYGVYQAFKDKDNTQLTGLQKAGDQYYLPATSFKGLVRSEVRVLLSKFLHSEKDVSAKLDKIFGNEEQKGRLLFSDMVLESGGTVKVKRFDKDKNALDGEPIYIKIDRLTGGALDGALKKQKETWGSAVLKCQLMVDRREENPFLFPLIYVLRRIGIGLIPMGGRTVIGLGEFAGTKVKLSGVVEEDIPTNQTLSPEQISKMREYYNSFERWCHE